MSIFYQFLKIVIILFKKIIKEKIINWMCSNWFKITVIWIYSYAFWSDNNSSTHDLSYLRFTDWNKIELFTLLFIKIEQHLRIACCQQYLSLVHLQNSVFVIFLIEVWDLLLHQQLKIIVVNCEDILSLN